MKFIRKILNKFKYLFLIITIPFFSVIVFVTYDSFIPSIAYEKYGYDFNFNYYSYRMSEKDFLEKEDDLKNCKNKTECDIALIWYNSAKSLFEYEKGMLKKQEEGAQKWFNSSAIVFYRIILISLIICIFSLSLIFILKILFDIIDLFTIKYNKFNKWRNENLNNGSEDVL
ncbi:hypothetical protein [Campylobacter hyointestinalis]|uniref:hypothetical protein n=1 Tax=Campylobacter hyointestinalis TaxID=198 RepID=UPI000CE2F25E|nr:hypothetical protein [Campylobacter hyointestinalis]PPB65663.1 hypothetical protein CDQ75_08715 [Campylobacter hyointestinalis subsp. hyointestinalis]